MAKSVVLYGRQGSGKSLYAEDIAKSLGLQYVVDLEDVQLKGDRLTRQGYLYMTCSEGYGRRAASLLGTPFLNMEDALKNLPVVAQEVCNG